MEIDITSTRYLTNCFIMAITFIITMRNIVIRDDLEFLLNGDSEYQRLTNKPKEKLVMVGLFFIPLVNYVYLGCLIAIAIINFHNFKIYKGGNIYKMYKALSVAVKKTKSV